MYALILVLIYGNNQIVHTRLDNYPDLAACEVAAEAALATIETQSDMMHKHLCKDAKPDEGCSFSFQPNGYAVQSKSHLCVPI